MDVFLGAAKNELLARKEIQCSLYYLMGFGTYYLAALFAERVVEDEAASRIP